MLPVKPGKHNSCGEEYIIFGNFRSVPGERFQFCSVPGARNCIKFHLFIDIIHDCCNHMTPLVHFKHKTISFGHIVHQKIFSVYTLIFFQERFGASWGPLRTLVMDYIPKYPDQSRAQGLACFGSGLYDTICKERGLTLT